VEKGSASESNKSSGARDDWVDQALAPWQASAPSPEPGTGAAPVPPIETGVDGVARDAAVWFYLVDGAETGPVGRAELSVAVGQGKVTGETLVWKDGMAGWQAGAEVAELAALFAPEPATPKRPPPPPLQAKRSPGGAAPGKGKPVLASKVTSRSATATRDGGQSSMSADEADRAKEKVGAGLQVFDTSHFNLQDVAEVAAKMDDARTKGLPTFDTAHFRLSDVKSALDEGPLQLADEEQSFEPGVVGDPSAALLGGGLVSAARTAPSPAKAQVPPQQPPQRPPQQSPLQLADEEKTFEPGVAGDPAAAILGRGPTAAARTASSPAKPQEPPQQPPQPAARAPRATGQATPVPAPPASQPPLHAPRAATLSSSPGRLSPGAAVPKSQPRPQPGWRDSPPEAPAARAPPVEAGGSNTLLFGVAIAMGLAVVVLLLLVLLR
jgi:hypothetical protein